MWRLRKLIQREQSSTRRKTRWEPIYPSFESSQKVEPFVKYFVVRVEEGKKSTMCPIQIETDLANQPGGPAETIRAGGRDSFLVSLYSENQSNKMKRVEQIAGNKCQVSDENFLKRTKGLVYIQNYHIEDLESFALGVKEQCRVKELVEAKWIMPRRETTQVFMIILMNDKLPEFIRIPGEAERTKVYEYKDRPMLCKKCWTSSCWTNCTTKLVVW